MKLNLIIILFIVSLLSISCEAPRDNPFDPASDDFTLIEGSVQTYSLPYTPLTDVEVYWKNSETLVKSDSTGKFRIANAKNIDGYLVFRKPGYRSDSVLIKWNDETRTTVQINMNRMPVLTSASITTSVINHSDNTRSFELLIQAAITDEDKDIDSVIVDNSKLGIRKVLEYDIINKNYKHSLSSDEVTLNDIEDIVGEDFNFYVTDIFNNYDPVGRAQVTRVIRSGATVISPVDVNTGSQPTLSWKIFQPGYTLSYTVEVYKSDPTNPQLVFRSTNLPMTGSSVKVNSSLAIGNYFWVIWTIDSFNNSSRSKPAFFGVR
jgi:hypothetical protein